MLQLVSIFEYNLIKKRRRKIRSRKLPNKLKYLVQHIDAVTPPSS